MGVHETYWNLIQEEMTYLLLYILGVYGSTLNQLEPDTGRNDRPTHLYSRSIWEYIKPTGNRIQKDDLPTPLYSRSIWEYIKPTGTGYRKTTYLLLYIIGVYGSTLNLLEPDTGRRPTYSSIFMAGCIAGAGNYQNFSR